MALNPHVLEDRQKIDDATARSHKDLEFYRKKRIEFMEAYLPTELQPSVPLNGEGDTVIPTMFQAIETDVYDLVAQNPRVTCETDFAYRKEFARRRGLLVNKRIAEIDFAEVLRAALYDAEFMLGILEVHNGESYPLDFGEYGSYDPGLPCIGHVPFDDYFYDTSVRRYCDRRFEGKFFRADHAALQKDPNISADVKRELTKVFTAEVTREDSTRAGRAAQFEGATADLLEPGVDLKTVYLCHEKLVVTLVVDKPDLPPLRVTKWKQPHGPFHVLQLGYAPDQVIGVSPASVILMLHNLVNSIWRKRREQAAQQKNVTAYQGAGKDDAQRLKDARNGEFIHAAHLDKLKMFSTMGPDPQVGQFGMEAQAMLNNAAGNLAMRMGTAGTTDTVGQDQMLLGAVSRMQAKKADSVLGFTANVLDALARLLDDDGFYSRDLYQEMPRKSMRVNYPWRPGEERGQPDQYTVRIVPYSMSYINPSAKFNAMTAYLQNTLAPMLPFGQVLDLGALNEMAAEYLDEPRLRDIFKGGGQTPLDPNNFGADMGVYDMDIPKPGKPNGNYTRRNVRAPGSDNYADKQLQAAMLGQKPQMMGSLPTGISDV